MWTKIKIAVGVFSSLIIGSLYMLWQKAVAERDTEKVKNEKYKDAVTDNIEELERLKHAQQIKNDIAQLSDDTVIDRLHDYARDRDSNQD